MPIKERLVDLDRKALGKGYDARDSRSVPGWVRAVLFLAPVLCGVAVMVAYLINHAAGVGVLIGQVSLIPVAIAARFTQKAPAR